MSSWIDRSSLTLLTDFYELTMAQGYFDSGIDEDIATFDMFFRDIPDDGGYAIMAGVETLSDVLDGFHFTEEDLDYLRGTRRFTEPFLERLRTMRLTCDISAVPEGMPIFPGEPIVQVRGPILEAQLIETLVLLTINHQSLIATKASRIVQAAAGRPVFEFGARRAQGFDAAVLGARATYIGGVSATSNTIAGARFGLPVSGTMAHSFVQAFDDEYSAFRAYATSYPDSTILLVDTYDVLRSGIPNAIRTASEILHPLGHRLVGVRIDSGDLAWLAQRARILLDEAGLSDCRIVASNALDEHTIRALILQGAPIDSFGVGERLITSRSEPVFGGVYKLAAVEREGRTLPRMKISENPGKITNPGRKSLWRFYERSSGKAIADVVALHDEIIDPDRPYELFDPLHTWKRKTIEGFTAIPMLQPVFLGGRNVFPRPGIEEIRRRCAEETARLWESVRRFENPQTYYVDLSQKLWAMKDQLLRTHG